MAYITRKMHHKGSTWAHHGKHGSKHQRIIDQIIHDRRVLAMRRLREQTWTAIDEALNKRGKA